MQKFGGQAKCIMGDMEVANGLCTLTYINKFR